MDFYKKIIRNKKLRFRILSALRFIPDEPMLKLQYRIKCGRKLDLKGPKRYTEKLQWLKLYYRDPVMQRCADKYTVRAFVQERGLGHILNDLYAVFSSPEEISLEGLPEKFAMKLSNGSNTNLLCQNKNELDLDQVRQKFTDYYAQSGSSAGREWVYRDGKPVIIVEQYLEDPEQKDASICDYKFLCFDGVPRYVVYDTQRFTDHHRNIYDVDWNDLHVASDCPCGEEPVPKPENLEQMLSVAKRLSEGFPAVRVDLYSIQGKIYFGELTFFPWSGYVRYTPDSFDLEAGSFFVLPEKNYPTT